VGWVPVGILDKRPLAGRVLENVPILGAAGDFTRILSGLALRGMRPRQLILTAARETFGLELVRKLQQEAEREGIGVVSIPELLQAQAGRATADVRQGIPVMMIPPKRSPYPASKRLLDIVVSAAILGLTAPLMAVIALALRQSVGPPVLFHQVRGGRNGHPFVMVKFRTMAETYGPDGRLLGNGERTPWSGRLLRRTRLDELPQFWNVLVGNMSIVGPRPLVAEELAELPDGGAERSSIRPGITGWAQVHGGQLLDLNGKVALDVWYARHLSLALDFRVLLLTVRMVVRGERLDEAALGRVQTARAEAGAARGAAWSSAH
jgi:lipopolysaccharide/colanic/teichoic acid biosynthesis glycosyltransferase